ncbi:dachshund homolog 2-like, partial [Protobothrops mucrosquamatus]|uniref:dachshund homolog 2-like n=1 Tax=Protobothrops mucrosquamatus TaxID=103944 RepID=UPI000775D2DB
EVQIAIPIMKPTLEKVQLAGQTLPPGFPAPFLFADGLSSVETLLTNIQVYLKGLTEFNLATIQKRLKKEKKAKRKLQEALEFESKRREQVEQALKQATTGDGLRMLNDAGIPEMEVDHNGTQHENAAMQVWTQTKRIELN